MRVTLFFVRMVAFLAGALALATSSPRPRRRSAGQARGETPRRKDDSGSSDDNSEHGGSIDDSEEVGPRSAAEWTVLAISAIVVALLVGAALYEHYGQEEPPGIRIAVELSLDQAEARDGLTYIPFIVRNTGRLPAESVVIRFEIKLGEETVEESTAEFAFLPNSGSVEGELVTALDLSTHTIEAQVATVQVP